MHIWLYCQLDHSIVPLCMWVSPAASRAVKLIKLRFQSWHFLLLLHSTVTFAVVFSLPSQRLMLNERLPLLKARRFRTDLKKDRKRKTDREDQRPIFFPFSFSFSTSRRLPLSCFPPSSWPQCVKCQRAVSGRDWFQEAMWMGRLKIRFDWQLFLSCSAPRVIDNVVHFTFCDWANPVNSYQTRRNSAETCHSFPRWSPPPHHHLPFYLPLPQNKYVFPSVALKTNGGGGGMELGWGGAIIKFKYIIKRV